MTDAAVKPDAQYLPGLWTAVAGANMWLLADVDIADPIVAACVALARRSAPLDRVLGALLSAELRPATDFAVVRHTAGAVDVVVRGDAWVKLTTVDGETVEIRADRPGSFADRSGDRTVAALALHSPENSANLMPAALGTDVVRASTIVVRLSDYRTTALAVPSNEVVASAPAGLSAPAESVVSTWDEPDSGGRFDSMFGATALPVPEEEELSAVPAAWMSEEPTGGGWLERPGQAASGGRVMDVGHSGGYQDDGVIDDVGWAVPVDAGRAGPTAEPHRPSATPMMGGGIDEELLMTRHRPERSATDGGSGAMVLAVRCGAGHLNPSTATRCRVCAAGIPIQSPIQVTRPPLGLLRLSNGEVFPLDRGVILGRAPGTPAGNDRDRPHHVRLPSPDNSISRKHLEVRVDGWQVEVIDLDSRNGTVVTKPGGLPERLPSGGRQLIEPGCVVSLDDSTSFRFEAAG